MSGLELAAGGGRLCINKVETKLILGQATEGWPEECSDHICSPMSAISIGIMGES